VHVSNERLYGSIERAMTEDWPGRPAVAVLRSKAGSDLLALA